MASQLLSIGLLVFLGLTCVLADKAPTASETVATVAAAPANLLKSASSKMLNMAKSGSGALTNSMVKVASDPEVQKNGGFRDAMAKTTVDSAMEKGILVLSKTHPTIGKVAPIIKGVVAPALTKSLSGLLHRKRSKPEASESSDSDSESSSDSEGSASDDDDPNQKSSKSKRKLEIEKKAKSKEAQEADAKDAKEVKSKKSKVEAEGEKKDQPKSEGLLSKVMKTVTGKGEHAKSD